MQASCKQNNNGAFQILGLIEFVHVVHQIGGVWHNPRTTKHGGSSSSTLVMTTSLKKSVLNYPGAEFVGTASIQVQRKEKFAILCLLDQHETLNFVISQWCLAENGKKVPNRITPLQVLAESLCRSLKLISLSLSLCRHHRDF